MIKRLLSTILILAVLFGIFVVPVLAAEDIIPDSKFFYTESSSKIGKLGSKELVYGTGSGKVGLGTQIEGTAWRLRNNAESPMGIGNANDSVPISFGISTSGENGYLFVKARPSTVLNGNSIKYTSDEANKIPALVLNEDLAGLSSSQKINIGINRTHPTVTPGIRFMVHNNGKNYYALLIAGNQWETNAGVELVKCTNGVVTPLGTFNYSNDTFKNIFGYFFNVEIIVNNGTIEFSVIAGTSAKETVNGSYTDDEPFNVMGNDSGVWLMATNGGNKEERIAQFRNFSIQNHVPFIDYTPSNIIFRDAAEWKKTDSDGIVDLGKLICIRKLLYSGSMLSGDVLVSDDRNKWYVLTDLNKFTNGSWTNNLTGRAFRYIKAGAVTDNIKVLTEIKNVSVSITDDPFTLYPRINGKDEFLTASILTDSSVINISDSVITPVKEGYALVTACVPNQSGGFYKTELTVNVSGNNFELYTDDISCASQQTYTGLGQRIEATNWRMRNADETTAVELEKHLDGSNVEFGINSEQNLYIEAPFNSIASFNESCAGTIPSLVLDRDLSEFGSDIKLSFKMKKDHSAVTTVVRFMVHNNGKNFYALVFGGLYYRSDPDNRGWELLKFTDGKMKILKQGGKKTDSKFAEWSEKSGNFWDVSIIVIENEISFTATQSDNNQNTFGSSYVDNEMFDISGKSSNVWLSALTGNNSERTASFKEFKIEKGVPYINGPEPLKVLYTDVAKSKDSTNGITDLDAYYTIRRIEANGNGTVYISKTGNRWFNLGDLHGGKVINSLTDEQMRYVKIIGDVTDIKVLAELSSKRIKLYEGESLTLYPYFNRESSNDIKLFSSSGNVAVFGYEITGKSEKNGVVITAINTAGNNMSVIVDVLPIGDMLIVYSQNITDTHKWDFVIRNELGISGNTNAVIVVFYHADGSMYNIQAFPDIKFDSSGKAEFTADKVKIIAGDYGICYIWNNLSCAKPIASAIELN